MAARKRKNRRRPRRRTGAWLLAAAVVVAVAGIGFLTWARTPAGRAALLRGGVGEVRAEVAADLETTLAQVLPAFRPGPLTALDGDAAAALDCDWPLAGGPDVRCRILAAPPQTAFHTLLLDLGKALGAAGAEVLWAERLGRPGRGDAGERRLLRVDVGVAGRPTHTLLLHPHGTPPPESRWGAPEASAPLASDLLGDAAQPTLAIVVDDWGNADTAETRAMLGLDVPLTISVLPQQRYSRRYALAATELALPETPPARRGGAAEAIAARNRRLRRERGAVVELELGRPRKARPSRRRREVLLHLPMQPLGYPEKDPGPHAVLTGMSRGGIAELLDGALAGLPGVTGVNNHMGSDATADRVTMDRLMGELRERDLIFVDSMTTNASQAYDAAGDAGVPALRNRLFLDQVERTEADVERLLARVVQAARAVGDAVAVCHPYPETVAVLERELGRYRREGVRFVTVSELLALKAERAAAEAGGGGP